ncbi:MAG: SsrA-binding protein SmpB [Clostridia bacterium]
MKMIASNKRAYYDYFISDVLEAGIVLVGSEVKSIRAGGVSLNESFITIKNGEIFLKNAYIKPYDKASAYLPEERRDRKLLLSKSQISTFERKLKMKGFTIVPIKIGLAHSFVKVEIGLGKGKREFDKRDVLKEKSLQREVDRAIKEDN